MKIKNIREIIPEPARCIEVDSPDKLFAVGGENGNAILSHNSVVQRNIIFSCILRPDSWKFVGIDLKKVELSSFRAYSNVVLGIATTLDDALTVLRFAQQTMMKRYAEMEQLGVNNFLDLPEKGQALLVMVDEAGELLSPSGVKALVGSTFVENLNNRKNLQEIQIGDTIFDNFGNPTTVVKKYEPKEQSRYDMKISSDVTKIQETIVSGSEHMWVTYFTHPDGTITGPETVDTKFLYDFKKQQEKIPENERIQVKFKKG